MDGRPQRERGGLLAASLECLPSMAVRRRTASWNAGQPRLRAAGRQAMPRKGICHRMRPRCSHRLPPSRCRMACAPETERSPTSRFLGGSQPGRRWGTTSRSNCSCRAPLFSEDRLQVVPQVLPRGHHRPSLKEDQTPSWRWGIRAVRWAACEIRPQSPTSKTSRLIRRRSFHGRPDPSSRGEVPARLGSLSTSRSRLRRHRRGCLRPSRRSRCGIALRTIPLRSERRAKVAKCGNAVVAE